MKMSLSWEKTLCLILFAVQFSSFCDATNPFQKRSIRIPAIATLSQPDADLLNHMSTLFLDNQNSSIINFAKQGMPLNNYLGNILMGEVSLGTPEQKLTLGFNNILLHTYVIDGEGCKSDRCKLRRRFRPSESKTLFLHGKQVKVRGIWTGYVGTDVLKVGQFSTNQTFVLMESLDDDDISKYSNNDEASKYDGELSLAFGNKVKSPVENILEQMDEKIISIWVENRPLATSAQITIGGKDEENCEKDWNFVDHLAKTKIPGAGTEMEIFWQVPVDKVQMFKGDVLQKELSDEQVLMLGILSVGIWGPKQIVDDIIKQVLEKNNLKEKAITVGCDIEGLPTVKLTIASKVYSLTPREYIVPLVSGSDKCYLSLYPTNENKWTFSLSFFRHYCIAFDYTPEKRRIGFATPIDPSNSTMFIVAPFSIVILCSSVS